VVADDDCGVMVGGSGRDRLARREVSLKAARATRNRNVSQGADLVFCSASEAAIAPANLLPVTLAR